jgi:hypothetical protein
VLAPAAQRDDGAHALAPEPGEVVRARLGRARIGRGMVWRSAQPGPHDLAWFRRQGVRTIISLRGG